MISELDKITYLNKLSQLNFHLNFYNDLIKNNLIKNESDKNGMTNLIKTTKRKRENVYNYLIKNCPESLI